MFDTTEKTRLYQQAENAAKHDWNEFLRLAPILDQIDREEHQHRLPGAALWYTNRGQPVFPLTPGGKKPLTRHGFKDATSDPTQIMDWWTKNPTANIGLPTGNIFDVIDIDGFEGQKHYDSQPMPDHMILAVVHTPRPGGRHIYIPAQNVGNTTNLVPHVDYRGTGGYVVAPPSVIMPPNSHPGEYWWGTRPAWLPNQTQG